MKQKILFIILVSLLGIGTILFFTTRTPGNDGSGAPRSTPMETVTLNDGDTYSLTAQIVQKTINGNTFRMLAYNGSIPGPLIKVPQGAEITIQFKNETDIGTTLHSHGVRLENAFDGVPDHTQPLILPGESFTYKVRVPDAGLYWYHPHFREDYAQELGLYGGYLVMAEDTSNWSPVNREIPLFLDDVLIENGRISLSQTQTDHALMGRFGNVMLVNGETDYALPVLKGEVVRFYVVNVANTRPFNFAIQQAKMKRVGADSGAYEREEWRDAILIGPSERTIVEVLFDEPGTFAIQNKTPEKTVTLGTVVVSDTPVESSYAEGFDTLRTHAETVASIDPFRAALDGEPDKHLVLTVDTGDTSMNMQGMGHGGHMMGPGPDGIEWEDTNPNMNKISNTDTVEWNIVDQDTGKENGDIDWTLARNTPVKIRIFNDLGSMHPMQHPIHFHGQRFLVVMRDGVKEENLVWKDTVLVPAGQTIDIVLDPSNPGTWMAHCHIAEHLESGMMFNYTVL